MRKAKIPLYLRTALWRTNKCRCFYCTEPVKFIDLHIDHIIPEDTEPPRLRKLIARLGLPKNFSLNAPENLVPTHHGCNTKKSNQEFAEETVRFYLELWRGRQGEVDRNLRHLQNQSKNETLLTSLASRIEAGYLSTFEAITFLERVVPAPDNRTSEPLVVCFGVDIENLTRHTTLQEDGPPDYVHFCDELEQNLSSQVHEAIPSLSVQSEASARNEESLSVRIAFWNLDVALLDQIDFSPWQVLEIASYSEIYEGSWNELFPRAVVQTYHDIIHDKNSKFNRFHLAICPQCASSRLQERVLEDYEHDEQYYVIECHDCGWGDWTQ